MANGFAWPGIKRLEERFDDQDRRSEERHKANTDRLEEVKALGEETVKEVSAVKERTTVIEDRADQIAKRTKVALTWRQGIVTALISGGAVYALHAAHMF